MGIERTQEKLSYFFPIGFIFKNFSLADLLKRYSAFTFQMSCFGISITFPDIKKITDMRKKFGQGRFIRIGEVSQKPL
jgi:hypothetical protein